MNPNSLHILNGDAIVSSFKKHFPSERYIVWREALCQGPLSYTIPDREFTDARIAFLESSLDANIEQHLFDQLPSLDLANVTEIVLWFEYDLFCQVNMMAVVSWLYQSKYKGLISILNLEKYQDGKHIGLGQINASEYPSISNNRIPLSGEEISYIDFIWSKISSSDFELLPYLNSGGSKLSRFNDAMRTAAIYSNASGIGAALIEARIYTTLKNKVLAKTQLLRTILNKSADLGYGDIQINHIIEKLLSENILYLKDNQIYKR